MGSGRIAWVLALLVGCAQGSDERGRGPVDGAAQRGDDAGGRTDASTFRPRDAAVDPDASIRRRLRAVLGADQSTNIWKKDHMASLAKSGQMWPSGCWQ